MKGGCDVGLYNTFRFWCCVLPGGILRVAVALLSSWAVMHSLGREEGIMKPKLNIAFCGLGG